ncbi:2-deoxy-5-keto-D-gluconate 6-phosphate aldolase domain-containing protein [Deinococcus sp.]|uniref:2-deoxy-5-keto-D-gluconate 6-phosphate aldolase domain-containing protein n=1 Tax=Deinococcus sp. TaxID=47478 RepID=UPI003CC523ED
MKNLHPNRSRPPSRLSDAGSMSDTPAAPVSGYNEPLYILPFDHRGSFEKGLFGWHEPLTPDQTARIADAKRVVYQGLLAALASPERPDGVPAARAGLLVDEQFGAELLKDARARQLVTACPAEKSGQDEFDFEYGEAFAAHIEAMNPTFCKVLVRYNPDGEAALNARQREKLARLSAYLHRSGRLFMFELLVPAEAAQLERAGGDKGRYDAEQRPELMVRAIEGLQAAGVEPDVWKVEGLDQASDAARIVEAARRGGRAGVGVIILGRGEDEAHVQQWLKTAARVTGFIGFAVGRTTFWEALKGWLAGSLSREEAVQSIAGRYREWVQDFEAARPT